uniref:Uncharacterized protein n=1 Tax=Timema tahoe TaxID=61484 RepID=A0A7R9P0W6_9NEOP|nr:unnamed protein product [Timema tahoe]
MNPVACRARTRNVGTSVLAPGGTRLKLHVTSGLGLNKQRRASVSKWFATYALGHKERRGELKLAKLKKRFGSLPEGETQRIRSTTFVKI